MTATESHLLRPHAEQAFADELRALPAEDRRAPAPTGGGGPGGRFAPPAVLEFVQVWNDFFVSLMISGAGVSPWSLLLWGEARHFEENLPQLAAGSLVFAIVPVTLLLATWRRFLVPALTGGVLR
ncbi:hypothetical protein [Nocardia cyriacigeorgica]|uniref:hypothetical protein n=1 Tax=Nocardia cyriacigeorgica TaxID=135487 RepID=UPI0024583C1B|nr:hypothetical protein [Nocardia cyriacigeorgica]